MRAFVCACVYTHIHANKQLSPITGARTREQYEHKATDGWPLLAKRYTAWGRAMRSPRAAAYAVAKTCSRLARFYLQVH